MEKYNYELPKISDTKLNEALKKIGKTLGFNEKIEVKTVKGGKEIIKMQPKYTLIKTHTARMVQI